jgi:hypothetical protein
MRSCHVGTGRIDQRLNQAGLRQTRGASKTRSIEDRGFERTGTLDTATSETPNPDIEPGIGILQVQVSGDFSLVGDQSKKF